MAGSFFDVAKIMDRAKSEYRTAPPVSDRMPSGIGPLVANEAAERFSFYGMKTILFVFMTKYLLDSSGNLNTMSTEEATGTVHLFVFGVYFFPILGGILADAFFGKYRVILGLSFVYCLGHFCLAMEETRLWLFAGLTLIAIGSGGIKSPVSAFLGDQFGQKNSHLLERAYGWFYFSINFGAFFSSLLTPILLQKAGPAWAFGVPGVLMGLATLVFWAGRRRYVYIRPAGAGYLREVCKRENLAVIGRLAIVFAFVIMFWSLYDQTASKWVDQASRMDRTIFGVELLPSQIQAVNPAMIMILIPVFTYFVYPTLGRIFRLTPLRKIAIGLFLAVGAFAISAMISTAIEAGGRPSVGWQLLAYLVITTAEVMVSITCLEFAYTQAPNKMKSLVMGLFNMSIAMGNLLTSRVNFYLASLRQADGEKFLSESQYYWSFAAAMLVTAVLFLGVVFWYKGKTHLQQPEAE
jgi:proton-dependent oligopeptide transporter, POT family